MTLWHGTLQALLCHAGLHTCTRQALAFLLHTLTWCVHRQGHMPSGHEDGQAELPAFLGDRVESCMLSACSNHESQLPTAVASILSGASSAHRE